jgi:hypothetical protein
VDRDGGDNESEGQISTSAGCGLEQSSRCHCMSVCPEIVVEIR